MLLVDDVRSMVQPDELTAAALDGAAVKLQPGLVDSDTVVQVPPGSTINYNVKNPLLKLMDLVGETYLSAGREYYLGQSLQYLIPFSHLELYGPQGNDFQVLDPRKQDNKTDFQKQNIKDFVTTDTYLVRGWVTAGEWTVPFLKLSYNGDPDSVLGTRAQGSLGPAIRVWLRVGPNASGAPIRVPYNEETDRYELELWGYPGGDLASKIDAKGRAALERGEIAVRPDLVQGSISDFARDGLDGRDVLQVATNNTMHPVLPLHVEVAWADDSLRYWDSLGGRNYQYEYNMVLRGWNNFLSVGVSPNPHGGVGFLHYRNVLSNYGRYANSRELGRTLDPWMFDAYGSKNHTRDREGFLAVDYVDLHIFEPNCGVGIHRHRDNQEIFFLVEGDGLMMVGDWEKTAARERVFEVRHLQPGHFSLLKPGQLHSLMNLSAEPMTLLMFGGYD